MKRESTLFFIAVFVVMAPLLHSMQGETEHERPGTAERRAEWFARQRGFESNKLPSGLRAQAMRRLEAMRALEAQRKIAIPAAAVAGSAASTSSATALTTTPWKAIGPSVVAGSLGEEYSGRISALAVDPRNPLVVYAGAADGGVWKTADGGQSWRPLTDSQPSLSTGSIALDPTNPDTIYVGTGEFAAGDGYPGAGILKSTDGGNSWTNVQGPFVPKGMGMRVAGIAVSPANSQVVLAAAAGSFPQNGGGIFRSADGGSTWARVLPAAVAGTSVVFDPQNGSIAYAGILNLSSGGSETVKVLKSTDAGMTWNATGLAETPGSRIMLAVAPTDSSVYAAFTAVTADQAFLFRSRDGGATFTNQTQSRLCGSSCGYNLALAVSPVNSDLLFFGGTAVLESSDGGVNWEAPAQTHLDQHALAFSGDGTRVYSGNDGGAWVATNLTPPVQFDSINTNLATLQFYPGISMAPGNPQFGLGGMQDNGVARYSGSMQWHLDAFGDGFSTAIDPQVPSTYYFGIEFGSIEKTTDNGASFQDASSGLPANTFFSTELTIDALSPNRLYTVRAGQVFQTNDGAASWHAISPQFTALNGSDIKVAPGDSNTVWTTGASGQVFVSRNAVAGAGATWATFSGPIKRDVSAIAISPTDPGTAYVTISGFASVFVGADKVPGHVFKVTNGGATWTDLTANLPDVPFTDIVIDPALANTLYVASDIGVFATSNGGTSWDTVVTNLPRSVVVALALDAPTRTLRAATHGRGMFDLPLPPGSQASGCTAPSTAANRSVTVCTPANGATLQSPFALKAATTDSAAVTTMQIYLDGVKVFEAPASSIDTTVTAATGAHKVTVKAWDAAGSFSQMMSITVSGNTAANLAVSPSSLTFASRAIGSASASQAVTLSNPSSTAVTIGSIQATGDFSQTNNCSSSIAAGGSCTISVTFTPTAAGARSGTLTISDSAANSPQTVSLNGTGAGGSGCTLSTVNPSVTICSPGNGATASSPVHIAAGTTDSHTVVTMKIYVDGVAQFTGASNSVDTSLAMPAGAHHITVKAWDNATPQQVFSQSIDITVAATNGSFTVSPSALTFGNQSVGSSSAAQTVTLNNTTANAVSVSSIAASGDFAQSNNCGSSVTANGSCTVSVTFAPSAAGTRSGTLTIMDSAGTQTVSLSGTGVTGSGCTLNSANPSVTICQPGNGAAVSSPVHMVASTTDSHTVISMKIYVDGVVKFTGTSKSLDTSLAMAAGAHHITVKAWDNASPQQVFSQSIDISVH